MENENFPVHSSFMWVCLPYLISFCNSPLSCAKFTENSNTGEKHLKSSQFFSSKWGLEFMKKKLDGGKPVHNQTYRFISINSQKKSGQI